MSWSPDLVAAEQALSTLLRDLLPASQDPSLAARLAVIPRSVGPVGLGGLLGQSPEPVADLVGTRLRATVCVTVRGANQSGLASASSQVSVALLAANPAFLRRQGLLRIKLDQPSATPRPILDNEPFLEDRISFDVTYEHIPTPAETDSIITRIPLDLDHGRSGSTSRVLANVAFDSLTSLSPFDVVDDPALAAGGPGDWRVEPGSGRVIQRSRARGGLDSPQSPRKASTQLILRAASSAGLHRDFLLRATVGTDPSVTGSGGIGLVFRWIDIANHYFFLMDLRSGYRMLARKVAGQFESLESTSPTLDTTQGYPAGQLVHLKVTALGSELTVAIDGQQIISVHDQALEAPGRVGLLARDNDRAFCARLQIESI